MNSIDIFIIIVMLFSAALGTYWGLIRQVLSLVGLVAGVVLASRYGPNVAEWLSSFIPSAPVVQVLGFLAVLIAVSSLASLLASLLHRFVGLLFLGWLDHLLGAALGLIQGALFATIVLAIAAANPFQTWSNALHASLYAPTVLRIFSFVLVLLPESLRQSIQIFFSQG